MWLSRVFKSGNGLAIILPASASRALSFKRGDFVKVILDANGLSIRFYGPTAIPQGTNDVVGDSGKSSSDAQRP